VPKGGVWRELINSDAVVYGGGNLGNLGRVTAQEQPLHGLPYSAEFLLPPLSAVAFKSP